ncbi:MAG: 1,2-phenylacetyl-CoA epoxidase subunit PaaC [Pseudonocardiaceae bacterium]
MSEDSAVEITAPIPAGVDPAELATYCLMLGDDALICAQRLCEWVTNAPELEEELALANIALDLIGQTRMLLSRAGHAEGQGRDEDTLAYRRGERQFRNVALAELGHGLDFGRAIAALLVFSSWRLALLARLVHSGDPAIAAVAAKGVKELTYHRDYAARWMVRLGDGTEVSHQRAQAGLDAVWPYVDELFTAHPVERRLAALGVAVDPAQTRGEVDAVLAGVLARARLRRPQVPPDTSADGRDGVHTAGFGPLLAELQGVARLHPEATW